MGCNNGKASTPGPQASKPEDAKPLLLGSEDPSAALKAATEKDLEGFSSMETEAPTSAHSEERENNKIQEAHLTVADEPHTGETPKELRGSLAGSGTALHFSPLSIVGVWHYDGKHQGTKYELSMHGDNLQIEQMIGKKLHRGILRPDGEWLVGHVQCEFEEVGTLRLQYQSGKLLSNFKVNGGKWGEDTMATKAGPSSSSANSSLPTAVQGFVPSPALSTTSKDKAHPQKHHAPQNELQHPAITAEDVGKAGQAAAARAGKHTSEDKAFPARGENNTVFPVRREKAMCCC